MGAAAPRVKQLKIGEPITTTTEEEVNSNSPKPEVQIDDEQTEELLVAKEVKGVLKKTKRNIEQRQLTPAEMLRIYHWPKVKPINLSEYKNENVRELVL